MCHFYLDEDYDRVIAHPNPKKKGVVVLGKMDVEQGFGVGQFINDAAKVEIDKNETNFVHASKLLEEYQKKSLDGANCEIDKKFWFIASKNIRQGEELFTHYGFEFWVHKLLQESTKPELRFLFYSLQDQATKPFNLRRVFEYDDATCKAFATMLLDIPEQTVNNYKNPKAFLFELMEKANILGGNTT